MLTEFGIKLLYGNAVCVVRVCVCVCVMLKLTVK